MAFSALALLAFLCGPSSDLLDYLPVNSYWQIKQVEMTPALMEAELVEPPSVNAAPLIDQLSDADPQKRADAKKQIIALGGRSMSALRDALDTGDPQTVTAAKELLAQISAEEKPRSIRRLMAIRALGESGDPSVVSALQPLTHSVSLFEADYAAAAIAQIQHHSTTRPVATAAEREADVWRLPADCALVAQSSAFIGHPISLNPAFAQVTAFSHQPQQQMVDQWSRGVIDLAETMGDFRLQAVTLGMSGNTSLHSGYVVIVFRGQFDSLALRKWLQTGNHVRPVGSVETYGMEFIWGFIADEHHLVIALMNDEINFDKDIKSIVDATTTGANDLHASTLLAPLLAKADMTQPLWGVARITNFFRAQAPELAPFDSINLDSKLGDNHLLHIKLSALGNDPAGARKTANDVTTQVANLTVLATPELLQYPMGKPVLNVLRSIHCDADAGTAFMTVDMPPSLFEAMMEAGSAPATQPAAEK